jgi:hypothetical protein
MMSSFVCTKRKSLCSLCFFLRDDDACTIDFSLFSRRDVDQLCGKLTSSVQCSIQCSIIHRLFSSVPLSSSNAFIWLKWSSIQQSLLLIQDGIEQVPDVAIPQWSDGIMEQLEIRRATNRVRQHAGDGRPAGKTCNWRQPLLLLVLPM